MLKTLEKFDSVTSSGILARIALSLNDNLNNNIKSKLLNEEELKSNVIKEILEILNIKNIENNKEKIVEYIDNEIEKENDDINQDEVLIQLAKKAKLPSDLYKIDIKEEIGKVYGDQFSKEYPIIEKTIKIPDAEYHFTNDMVNQPGNISLFLKKFKGNYPYNDFNLLVIGQRIGIKLIVHQVWKMYEDLFKYDISNNLVSMLKEFTEKFGVEVTFRNQKAKFFLSEIAQSEKEFNIDINNKNLIKDKNGNTNITFAHFTESVSNKDKKLSLFLVIDLNKYKNYLQKHKEKM